jgi:hypothetical protein
LKSVSLPERAAAPLELFRVTALERRAAMGELRTVELKAFVPSKNFALSKQFYQELGFEVAWSSDDLAYLRRGGSSFLLQNFYNKEHADNFMMHLLVEAQGLISRYGVRAEAPADKPWGIRDFVIVDPTGVLWRIGQNIEPAAPL